jgi:hypothetical protein
MIYGPSNTAEDNLKSYSVSGEIARVKLVSFTLGEETKSTIDELSSFNSPFRLPYVV